MSPSSPPPRCSLRRINKWIGKHRILSDVSLELQAGEIHALVGANGAGKSTLIRILSGADTSFNGELWRDGQRLALRNPREGRRAGIHVIYQELSLVNSLSATDNWLLSEERAAFSWLSREQVRQNVVAYCDRLGIRMDVDVPVETLSLSERQLLEIGHALSQKAHVLVLDEPTSALSEREASRLLEQLDQLRQDDVAILYVSHRMDEIYRIADRITVLRDGRLVTTQPTSELDRTTLIGAMIGEVTQIAAHSDVESTATPGDMVPGLFEVEGLDAAGNPPLRGISFEVNAGEVLGVAGLSGSGASELLQVLGGARRSTGGLIKWGGARIGVSTPEQAFAAGLAFLPADRKKSVLTALSILDNASLSALARFAKAGLIDRKVRARAVAQLAEAMALGHYALDLEAGMLSGGNQQKLALMRCLLTEPKLLLLDEPTRGVDVAAKLAIHQWIRELAARGLTVLVQSSELDELMDLSKRIIVLRQGRLVADFKREQLERASLQSAMMGNGA